MGNHDNQPIYHGGRTCKEAGEAIATLTARAENERHEAFSNRLALLLADYTDGDDTQENLIAEAVDRLRRELKQAERERDEAVKDKDHAINCFAIEEKVSLEQRARAEQAERQLKTVQDANDVINADLETAEARAERLEAVLREIRDSSHQSYQSTVHGGSGPYVTGVADGHRCAAKIARAALEADDA
jgi:chromosome segregation ATPase